MEFTSTDNKATLWNILNNEGALTYTNMDRKEVVNLFETSINTISNKSPGENLLNLNKRLIELMIQERMTIEMKHSGASSVSNRTKKELTSLLILMVD